MINTKSKKKTVRRIVASAEAVRALEAFEQRVAEMTGKPVRPKAPRLAALQPWHCQAIQLILFSGYSPTAAAKKFSKDPRTLNNVMDSDLGRRYIEDLVRSADTEAIRNEVKSLWFKSLLILRATLDSTDPDLKVKKIDLATKMLELNIKEPDKVHHIHEHYDAIKRAIETNAREREAERTGNA